MTNGNIFVVGATYFPLWTKLAELDVGLRFRRSKLGILWLVVPSLAFAFGAGFIWANLFRQPPGDFIPFVALGFAIWGYLAGSLVEGGNVFVNAQGYIRQVPLPLGVFVYRTFAAQTLYFLIGLLTGLATVLIFKGFDPIGLGRGLLGLSMLILFSFSAVYMMAFLGARFRDIPMALQSLLQILFVVSPVIYPASILEERGLHFVAAANPLACLIEVVRTPIVTGEWADPIYYAVAGGVTAAFLLTAALFHALWAKKVVYWL
jgi:ABC-type polysaccharide/polyol phosphate export permease